MNYIMYVMDYSLHQYSMLRGLFGPTVEPLILVALNFGVQVH